MEYLALSIISIISIGIGILVGIFIGTERMRKAVEDQSVGNLRIDQSEPDEPPRPFLEVKGTNLDAISNKKFIILKVINENYLPRD